jgi:hypothetical protein
MEATPISPLSLFGLGRSDRSFIGGTDPVKKHGPGMYADLRLVMPLGDPV